MLTIVVVRKRPKGISECFYSAERAVGASVAFLIFLPHTHSHIKGAFPPTLQHIHTKWHALVHKYPKGWLIMTFLFYFLLGCTWFATM